MHERLFAEPKALTHPDLVRRAQDLELDQARFRECLERNETDEKIRADQAEGKRLGVTGTPAFFVGAIHPDGSIELIKRVRGAAPFAVFERVVDEVRGSRTS
jgi:protein-disulfide isomerase